MRQTCTKIVRSEAVTSSFSNKNTLCPKACPHESMALTNGSSFE